MEKNKKTTSASTKTKTASSKTTVTKKKRKRITNRDESPEGPGEKNKTTDYPEQHEEFINEIPDEEKTEEANEVTNDNDPGRNENVNQSGQKWHK